MTPCSCHHRLHLLLTPDHPEANEIRLHVENCPECQASFQLLSETTPSPSNVPTRVVRVVPDPVLPLEPHLLPESPTMMQVIHASHIIPRDTLSLHGKGMPPPRSIAGYDIFGELGRGGMGIVYHAFDTRLKRHVALKMVIGGLRDDAEMMARFRSEAELIAQMQHPNIVQVYEVGETDGLPYLALEYIAGGTLHTRIGGLPQPPHQVAALVHTLAVAIDHAHRRGVVHRDLKPVNILLGQAGMPLDQCQPKISDFGLARMETDDVRRTRAGDILGTPGYLAPEQAEGNPAAIGVRSDVYALGIILYECLTGRPPFYSPNALDTLLMVRLQEPVPPSRFQPSIPHDLEVICLKCLQKDPARRYDTGEALADDLQRFLSERPIEAKSASMPERLGKWAHREPWLAFWLSCTILAVVVGFVGVTWAWLQASHSSLEARTVGNELREQNLLLVEQQAKTERQRQLAIERGTESDIRLVRNMTNRGLTLAQTNDIASGMTLMAKALQHVDALKQQPDLLPNTRARVEDYDRFLRSNLANWSLQSNIRLRAQLPHANQCWDVAFSPDGKLLATADYIQSLRFWDAVTGQSLGQIRHDYAVRRVEFHPSGRRLVTASYQETGGQSQGVVNLFDMPDRKRLPTTVAFTAATTPMGLRFYAGYSPEGRYLYSQSAADTMRIYDAETLRELAAIKCLGDIYCLSWSANDRYLAIGSSGGYQTHDVQEGDFAGRRIANAPVTALAYRPDGRGLLLGILVRNDVEVVASRITIVDPEDRVHHFSTIGDTCMVRWMGCSPDGTTFAAGITRYPGGSPRNPPTSILLGWDVATFLNLGTWSMDGQIEHGAFSADSQSLVVGCTDGVAQLFRVPGWDWYGPIRSHDYNAGIPRVAFAPDNQTFALSSIHTQNTTAILGKLLPDPNFAPVISLNNIAMAVGFGSEGRELWHVMAGGAVRRHQVSDGRSLPGGFQLQNGLTNYAISPDGSLLAAWTDYDAMPWMGGLYDIATGNLRLDLNKRFSGLAFSGDSRRFLTYNHADTSMKVWDIAMGDLVRSIQPGGMLIHASLDAKGEQIVVIRQGEVERPAVVWDVASGTPLDEIPTQVQAARRAVFNPQRDALLLLHNDQTLWLWNRDRTRQNKLFRPLFADNLARNGSIGTPLFTPDGRLGVINVSQRSFIWDLQLGMRIGPPLSHRRWLTSVAMHPSGQLIASAGEDNKIRIFQIASPLEQPAEQIRQSVELLTRMSLEEGDAENIVTLTNEKVIELRKRYLRQFQAECEPKPIIIAPSPLGIYERIVPPHTIDAP